MAALKNRKREHFAHEIAAMTPLERAYVASGYRASPFAKYNASKLANMPAVRDRINELRTEIGERVLIHAEYIQRQLLPLVEANPQDLYKSICTADGETRDELLPITKMPRDLAAAIKKIKLDPETGAVLDIELHNRIEAGTVLLRSVGGFVDKLDVSVGKKLNELTLEEIDQLEEKLLAAAALPTPMHDDAGGEELAIEQEPATEGAP